MNVNKDIMGVFFSCLCLTHCLMGPIMIFLGLSSISLAFLEKEWVHYLLIVPMLLFVIWSIPSGFRIHHKPIPSVFASIGVVLFVLGLFASEANEEFFVIGASCMIIIAHLCNRFLLVKFKN